MEEKVNLTPSPRILEVITHNPMPPIHALCELIDNSIDGFKVAEEMGAPIQTQQIDIILPKAVEIKSGIGKIVIKDNGPGMDREIARNAVTAGYSGNNQFERLGLFGLGFNIATGKLGRKTVLKTARKKDNKLICITIDLPEMKKNKSFDVPIEEVSKPAEDASGTQIEISGWWPEGHQNCGFVEKLVRIGQPELTRQIGRRYSTLLRKNLVILINGKECVKHHHCSWLETRYVEKQKYGQIPAKFNINKRLGIEKRCYTCGAVVPQESDECSNCGPKGVVKTKERVIRGWLGIQRFDDYNKYGIDFIRNGRAILIDEKESVFTWTSPSGEKIKEYPVDGVHGRIIGEIHVDHVPTDFTKTDFQRTSSEWAEAIKFLHGEGCLLPETHKKYFESENESILNKLVRGYSKVRGAGRAVMYMGYWDEAKGEPSRISREVQAEYYEKFLANEPGYGPRDDSEWWKLVEAAEIRPAPDMKECPQDGTQNLMAADICTTCGYVFISKKCIQCGEDIAQSKTHCDKCGKSQIPEIETQWVCNSCLRRNPPEAFECRRCHLPRGVEDPLRVDFLKENSALIDELSDRNISLQLPGDVVMSSLRIKVYCVKSTVILKRDIFRIPAVVDCTANEMAVFLDLTHEIFNKYQDRPEDVISIEVAKWIWQNNQGRITDDVRALWSLSNLYYLVHAGVWGKRVELDKDEVLKEVGDFFDRMRDQLPELLNHEAITVYENLDNQEQSRVMEQLFKNNLINRMEEMKRSGEFLSYLPTDMMIALFKDYPGKFFDGLFWKDPYDKLDVPDGVMLQKLKKETAGKYHRCLEDMLCFSEYRNPDINYIRKINQTLKMVREHLTAAR